ncbi:ERCC4 domain-containing protein [Sarocladium implicatum]|nr:ERCC4 domain-containing protein [Sarocladium implicatum]
MAPDVIDLISSSPPPDATAKRLAERRDSQSRTARLKGGGNTLAADAADKAFTSSYSTFSFPSSDAGPLSNTRDLPLDTSPSPKRRRLTPQRSPVLDPRSSPSIPDHPLDNVITGQPDRRKILDATVGASLEQISSSNPFASSPLPAVGSIAQVHRPAPTTIDLSSPEREGMCSTGRGGRHHTSDSFASSLQSLPVVNDISNADVHLSSPNPFASSPTTVHSRTKRSTLIAQPLGSSSDPFESSPAPKQTKTAATKVDVNKAGPQRSTREKSRNYDPISSSAPEISARRRPPRSPSERATATGKSVITIVESDSEAAKSSDDDLPDLHNIRAAVPGRALREPMRRALSDTYASNRQIKSRKAASPKTSTENRAMVREQKIKAQQADKEAKKQEREQQKRIRALEKEKAAALAEVNKIRTDKKVSTKEMVVDLPAGLDETLRTQVETILEGLDVQHTMWQSPISNVVRLRRKVDSRFDDDLGYWVPCPQTIEEADHIIVVVTAAEIVRLAHDGLDAFVKDITQSFQGKRPLYILEGIGPWLRKNRNARNRQFASGVRAQENSATTSSQPRRRANANPPPDPVSEEIVEDALLQLQVLHGVLIHHTNIPLETAQWIGHFTQHISTVPYRRQRELSTTTAGFCMESGQVRTGDDADDTYVRMLQEVARVTQPIAYGVAAEFGSVTKLVKGLEEGGPGRLEGVRKCANKDGAFSDRTLGKAMSRRLWQVFLGKDEASTDV